MREILSFADGIGCNVYNLSVGDRSEDMYIEWLVITVPAEWRERYLVADEAIWTAFLTTCPGYLGKEIWLDPTTPDTLVMVIRWASRAEWKAIDPDALAAVEANFVTQLGQSFAIQQTAEYIVQTV